LFTAGLPSELQGAELVLSDEDVCHSPRQTTDLTAPVLTSKDYKQATRSMMRRSIGWRAASSVSGVKNTANSSGKHRLPARARLRGAGTIQRECG
jgi:hypothetical protein